MPNAISKLFLKSTKVRDIYIVSGLPRSGTSMMMKILAAAGLSILTDNLRAADENNPKGYYEYERVKNLKTGDFDWLPEAEGKVVKIISALLEFLPNNYHYKVIFMKRELEEILSSQRHMLSRDNKSDNASDSLLGDLYDQHLSKIEGWLDQQPNIDVLYVNYNKVIQEPKTELEKVNQFLGGQLSMPTMLQVVDRDLYRERSKS